MRTVAVNAINVRAGGGLRHLIELIRNLPRALGPDWRVRVVLSHEAQAALGEAPAPDGPLELLPIRSPLGLSPRRFWAEQVVARRLLLTPRPDVLLSPANSAILACPVPQLVMQRNALYFDHAYLQSLPPVEAAKWRLYGALTVLSIRAADTTVTPTRTMADLIRHHGSHPPVVLPHGVAPPPSIGDGDTLQPNDDAVLRLGYLGSASRHKGLQRLSPAMRAVAGADRRVELSMTLAPDTIQGLGLRDVERDLKGRLTVRAAGTITHAEAPSFLRQLDVLLVPSHTESFCLPVWEAAAVGTPVVAQDIAAIREIALDGQTILTDFDDPAAVAEAVEKASRLDTEPATVPTWQDHFDAVATMLEQLATSDDRGPPGAE